jgi:hypothetical protein
LSGRGHNLGMSPNRKPAPAVPGERAARVADARNRLELRLPVLGDVDLPGRDAIAFAAGLGVLAALGVIEWPVAALIGAGHYLSRSHQSAILRDFGAALEEA